MEGDKENEMGRTAMEKGEGKWREGKGGILCSCDFSLGKTLISALRHRKSFSRKNRQYNFVVCDSEFQVVGLGTRNTSRLVYST